MNGHRRSQSIIPHLTGARSPREGRRVRRLRRVPLSCGDTKWWDPFHMQTAQNTQTRVPISNGQLPAGGVFAWGDNTCGQLGIGPLTQQQQQQHPTKRCINTPAVVGFGAFQGNDILPCSISAGRRHSACIDMSGRVMCWGDQSMHQCGVPTSDACVESPKVKIP
jgi:alpha-tubulin suppressor-like RCC1 family protein